MVLGEHSIDEHGFDRFTKYGQVFMSLRDERRDIIRQRMERQKAEDDRL